jgi:predicted ATPase
MLLLLGHATSSLDLKDVFARTGGMPLFVEDVTRLLLEFGEAK